MKPLHVGGLLWYPAGCVYHTMNLCKGIEETLTLGSGLLFRITFHQSVKPPCTIVNCVAYQWSLFERWVKNTCTGDSQLPEIEPNQADLSPFPDH